MKSLIKNQDAVAYLLLVGLGLTIIVVGIAYNFISDFLDLVLTGVNNYAGTPLAGQMDQDTIQGGYLLMAIFKYILIPTLLIIAFWIWTMAQKPERTW